MSNVSPTNNSILNNSISMNATQNTTYQPKKKGVSIYDVNKDRMVYLVYYKNPYGVKAKAAYKRYLAMGYEPWMILPPDLKHHPPSYTSSRHTFTKRKPKKPKAPTIEGRTSFKNFLASFTIHNHTNLKKLNGFNLLDQFIPAVCRRSARPASPPSLGRAASRHAVPDRLVAPLGDAQRLRDSCLARKSAYCTQL
eukprot:SAG22_NODE_53_length_24242_cov_158.884231_19_plen_195_part_00